MRGASLAVWGGGSTRALRALPQAGSEVVSWLGAETRTLAASGVPFRRLEDVLGAEGLSAAESAGRSWARVWARLPLLEGRSFRDLLEWRGESLLFAAEGFLRTETAGPRCAQTAELCLRLLETLRPAEIDAHGLAPADAVLLARAATARGVLFHGAPGLAKPLAAVRPPATPWTPWRRVRGLLSRPARLLEAGRAPSSAPLLLFVGARSQDDALEPLVRAARDEAETRVAVLAAEALARYETRQTRRAIADGERRLHERLSALRGTPAVAASHAHRGVGFADLAAGDLDALLLGRLPNALRTLERGFALFAAARPALAVITLADRDERRTFGMAATAAGTPWVTLRLDGVPDDEPARADGGPRPAASLAAAPGDDARVVLGRLRALVHDRVSAP